MQPAFLKASVALTGLDEVDSNPKDNNNLNINLLGKDL